MKYLITFCLFLPLFSCNNQLEPSQHKYYSWEGLEPDRWASIWLLKRHIDLKAEISILPVGAQINNVASIATENSDVKRTHGFSNFENLLKTYDQNDDIGLIRIGLFINELEISPWASSTPAVAVVEAQFRELQFKYNRVDVPYDCYAGFFDILYGILKFEDVSDNEEYLNSLYSQLEPDNVCNISSGALVLDTNMPVPEYPVDHVLKLINANKTVVFVDTREDDEFDEHHIPGAINLKLREVDKTAARQFEKADLVISYCIKDFRGYEVALALSKVGVKNIGIMNPYGLKGWKDLNLPVADSNVSDNDAIEALKKRAAQGV